MYVPNDVIAARLPRAIHARLLDYTSFNNNFYIELKSRLIYLFLFLNISIASLTLSSF